MNTISSESREVAKTKPPHLSHCQHILRYPVYCRQCVHDCRFTDAPTSGVVRRSCIQSRVALTCTHLMYMRQLGRATEISGSCSASYPHTVKDIIVFYAMRKPTFLARSYLVCTSTTLSGAIGFAQWHNSHCACNTLPRTLLSCYYPIARLPGIETQIRLLGFIAP
jgi:hypothetical protein